VVRVVCETLGVMKSMCVSVWEREGVRQREREGEGVRVNRIFPADICRHALVVSSYVRWCV